MTDKRRRRRKPAGPSAAKARGDGRREHETGGTEPAPPAEREGFLRRVLRPRQPAASPFPTLGESLGRGAMAVGSSPLILGAAFLGLLALWGGFALLDTPLPPQSMVYAMGLPPVHVPLDVGVLQSLLRTSTTVALLAVVALGVGRGLLLGILALLVVAAVRGGIDLRSALRRLPGVVVAQFGIFGAEIGAFLFLLLFLQSILGPAAVLVMLVLGLHFLGFAPVVAAAEGAAAGRAMRLGFRVSRLPGPRHLLLVLVYFLVILYAGAGATSVTGGSAPATPSILTWALALLATFGHAVVLGALAYRWDSVRERVLAGEAKREAERRSARGRGRGRAAQPARDRKTSGRARTSAQEQPRTEDRGKDEGQGRTARAPPGPSRGSRRGQKGRGPRKGKRR